MSDNANKWSSPTLARLEADIAYFDARLSLLKSGPASCYQEAQIKAYRALESLLVERLSRFSGQESGLPNDFLGQIEVEEMLAEEIEPDSS